MKIQQQVIIKPENISLAAATPTTTLEQLFIKGYQHDLTTKEIIKAMSDGSKRHANIQLSDCAIKDDKFYLRDRLLVPSYTLLKLRLIMEHHD